MTEAEWLVCDDPQPMLLEQLRRKASDRKLRLFAVACCRRIWHLLTDERARRAAEVAECVADNLATDLERRDARKAAQRAAQNRELTRTPAALKWERRAASAVYHANARSAEEAAINAGQLAVEAIVWKAGGYSACDWRAIRGRERPEHAALLRDIFGNPFRPVAIDPAWLWWNGGTVPAVARRIYDDRRWGDMPILADALMDAGCDNAEILDHCRKPGEHVRGCWVVDLLLGKE